MRSRRGPLPALPVPSRVLSRPPGPFGTIAATGRCHERKAHARAGGRCSARTRRTGRGNPPGRPRGGTQSGAPGDGARTLPQQHTFDSDTRSVHLQRELQRAGYKTERTETGIIARKGRSGRWGSTIIHVSVLAVMLGALLAETGFVGTQNIYVGDSTRTSRSVTWPSPS